MIRWYDYVVAVFIADLMLSSFLYAMTVETWWLSLIGSIAVLASWDIWKFYCEWRRQYESKR